MDKTPIQMAFQDYASHHRTPGNQFCHTFGIPAVLLSTLGLLGPLTIAGGLTGNEFIRLDAGTLTWSLGMIWYLAMDWKLALPFGLVSFGLYLVGRAIPLPALAAIFVVAWIVQFIGHGVYEKKSPAFFKSLSHFLVGPFWIFAKMVGYSS